MRGIFSGRRTNWQYIEQQRSGETFHLESNPEHEGGLNVIRVTDAIRRWHPDVKLTGIGPWPRASLQRCQLMHFQTQHTRSSFSRELWPSRTSSTFAIQFSPRDIRLPITQAIGVILSVTLKCQAYLMAQYFDHQASTSRLWTVSTSDPISLDLDSPEMHVPTPLAWCCVFWGPFQTMRQNF